MELTERQLRSQSFIEKLGRTAFWDTDSQLSRELSRKYPNGCSLFQAIAWAKSLRWNLSLFRNLEGKIGPWMFFYCITEIGVGPHKTITGETVHVSSPMSAWSGCKEVPSFPTREEAEAWARENDFKYECIE